jgi:hypothetical protein
VQISKKINFCIIFRGSLTLRGEKRGIPSPWLIILVVLVFIPILTTPGSV